VSSKSLLLSGEKVRMRALQKAKRHLSLWERSRPEPRERVFFGIEE